MGNSGGDSRKLQSMILKGLHQGQSGVSRMKATARSYLWWPGLDKDLEKLAKSCLSCQAVKQTPPVAPLHPWIWPVRPWQRIHVDFAGLFYIFLWSNRTPSGLKCLNGPNY